MDCLSRGWDRSKQPKTTNQENVGEPMCRVTGSHGSGGAWDLSKGLVSILPHYIVLYMATVIVIMTMVL